MSKVICTYDGALTHPQHRRHVVVYGLQFESDDPLVRTYPWAFDELTGADGGGVERATRAPGEKRTTRRRKQTDD